MLLGLQYLHSQGVLHRDIKGANILTDKTGAVKLADFGVAVSEQDTGGGGDDLDVVGTPYWMAPEIVEMAPPSTACDIWAVGCTIIELLSGSPPYFDLPPMAALFRIVQDDYPPFPDGISDVCSDFLTKCFNKVPDLRKKADELLNHDWITNQVKHVNRVSTRMNQEHLEDEAVRSSVRLASTAGGGIGMNLSDVNALQQQQLPSPVAKKPDAFQEEDELNWDDEFGDGDAFGGGPPVGGGAKLPNPFGGGGGVGQDSSDIADWIEGDDDMSSIGSKKRTGLKPSRSIGDGPILAGGGLDKWKDDGFGDEGGEDEFLDDFDISSKGSSGSGGSLGGGNSLAHKLNAKMHSGMNETTTFDVDLDLDIEFDFQTKETKDEYARASRDILEKIEKIPNERDEDEIIELADSIMDELESSEEQRFHFFDHHGVLSVIEMLSVPKHVLPHILEVINALLEDNQKALETISLLGVLPQILNLITDGDDLSVLRLEAARFAHKMFTASKLSLQMIMGAGCIPSLVNLMSFSHDLIQDGYAKEMVCIGIDGILALMDLTTIKLACIRIMVQNGLLDHLVGALEGLMELALETEDDYDWVYAKKVAEIYAILSRGGPFVAIHISQPFVLRGLISTLAPAAHAKPNSSIVSNAHYLEVAKNILRSLQNLSSVPDTLDLLEKAEVIPSLVPLLGGPFASLVQTIVVTTLFNMCKIKKSRMEQAANSGLVPHLIVLGDLVAVRQMVLQIMCDLASAPKALPYLWSNNYVDVYLDLMEDQYWATFSLNSLAIW